MDNVTIIYPASHGEEASADAAADPLGADGVAAGGGGDPFMEPTADNPPPGDPLQRSLRTADVSRDSLDSSAAAVVQGGAAGAPSADALPAGGSAAAGHAEARAADGAGAAERLQTEDSGVVEPFCSEVTTESGDDAEAFPRATNGELGNNEISELGTFGIF